MEISCRVLISVRLNLYPYVSPPFVCRFNVTLSKRMGCGLVAKWRSQGGEKT
jgi:hypothetical protein